MELGAPSAVPIASGGVVRTYDEEMSFIEQVTPTCFKIKPGFVPNMTVPGYFYVNSSLSELMFGELQQYGESAGVGGFMPAVKQIANVAALPGIVGVCLPPPQKKKKKIIYFSLSDRLHCQIATAAMASQSETSLRWTWRIPMPSSLQASRNVFF